MRRGENSSTEVPQKEAGDLRKSEDEIGIAAPKEGESPKLEYLARERTKRRSIGWAEQLPERT